MRRIFNIKNTCHGSSHGSSMIVIRAHLQECLGLYLEQFTDTNTCQHAQKQNQELWMRSCGN